MKQLTAMENFLISKNKSILKQSHTMKTRTKMRDFVEKQELNFHIFPCFFLLSLLFDSLNIFS